MGHSSLFLSVIFITLVAFSSGKQQYISDDSIHVIFIEHSYGRKQKKRPYMHSSNGSLRTNGNLL